MTVRPARPGDAAALAGLQACLSDPNPALLAFALDSSLSRVLVSVADGAPAGYLLALPGDAEDGAFVAELAVAPGHRREGRATALLSALFERVDGRVALTVAPENEAARSLYRSLGFERVGRREGYYDDDRPALVLAREA